MSVAVSFSAGALAAAGAAATSVMPAETHAKPPPARVDYPSSKIGTVAQLKPNTAVDITYPDKDSPGVLIKLGTRVPGGVGPDVDIVAFSALSSQGLSAELPGG